MNPHTELSRVTHYCRQCGHHLCRPQAIAGEVLVCSVCHSQDIESMQVRDPDAGTYHDTTVVFRVSGSREQADGFFSTLDTLFRDDGLAEIVAIEAGNKLQLQAGGQ
ncbi:hypothetical protein [uncultured Pseudomonas sp.]|uniref:hypothetical protein n=1 Tax=uncultured Pseudomonas sp. TaxID=114707 RepID=UPI0025F22A21|nr:hypothetical protein [uncultured Pseudomonas sp.]